MYKTARGPEAARRNTQLARCCYIDGLRRCESATCNSVIGTKENYSNEQALGGLKKKEITENAQTPNLREGTFEPRRFGS